MEPDWSVLSGSYVTLPALHQLWKVKKQQNSHTNQSVLKHMLHLFYFSGYPNRSAERPQVEPGRGAAVLQRESRHVRAHFAEGVQCVAAALAHARTHGPHASALYDPECVH